MSRTEAKSLKRENLELMLLKKKECTTKALQCVETLIELNVLESTFRQTLPHINQSTYQDVVDERSITYVCGYPLCASQLKDVPKKQYSIVRCNGQLTLFDTVERKKFCSNICYKASKFIHDQLPSSPLWLIETKETDQFTLIPLDSIISRCSYGEEIQMNIERPVTVQDKKSSVKDESDEDKSETGDLKNSIDKSIEVSKVNDQSGSNNEEEFFDSCSSFDNNQVKLKSGKHEENGSADEDHGKVVKNSGNYLNCDEVSREDTSIGNNPHEQSNGLGTSHSKIEEKLREQGSRTDTINKTESNKVDIQSFDTKVNELEKRNDGKQSPVVGELNVNPKEENKKGKVKSKRKKLDKGKSKDNPDISPVLAAVTNTERKIREWISVESLNFIFGPEKLRNILEEQGLLAKMQEKKIDSARDPYLFERYVEICTRLNILDLKDAKFDKEVKDESTIPSKPLPDFKKLKEEAKAMELKVRSFYAGDKRVQFSEAIMEESESKYEKQNVLPLVDQHAQYAFRRRIVLDHLNKVLPDVLKTVGVANLISKKDIRDLVHTFSLSANNVVFKPIEWQFIAVIIVKLFSVRDEELAKLLAAEKARKYLTLILMSYEQDSEYLDRLMTWLLYEHSLFQA